MRIRYLSLICVGLTLVGVLLQVVAYAQKSNISYLKTQTFITGTAIVPLIPTNTGGQVPATIYGQATIVAGSKPTQAPVDAVGTAAGFTYPADLAIDKSGNMYVTDNTVLRRISPSGMVTTLSASQGFAAGLSGSQDFYAASLPVAADNDGNIYVVAFLSQIIEKVTPDGAISVFAGNSTTSATIGVETDGTGTNASFVGIGSIVADQSGNLYVGDRLTIRKITPSGVVTTLAGNNSTRGLADGHGPAASFTSPGKLFIDKSGNLNLTDGTGVVRKITPAGDVTTTKLNLSYPYLASITMDGDDNYYLGFNTTSPLIPAFVSRVTPTGDTVTINRTLTSLLGGIALDNNGNLIVIESNTALIKRITLTGYTIDSPLPAGLKFDSATGIISGTPSVPVASKVYTITAYNTSGSSSYQLTITVASLTTSITSISPSTAASNTTIKFKGQKFTGATAISFGGTPAKSFTVTSDTTLTAIVDNGTSGPVSVTTPSGTGTLPGFIFVPIPIITADGPLLFFTGGSVTLSANPAGFSYQWYKDNVLTVGATASNYTASLSGSYTVSITSDFVTQTSAPTIVTAKFNLPQNNFELTATSTSCKGTNDGIIKIDAVQKLNYTATITGNNFTNSYTFDTTLSVNNLISGTYNVCITVDDEPGYQQCFDVVISEPKDLSVYATIDNNEKNITLALNGADQYNIYLNGIDYFTTHNTITLPLNNAGNNLEVVTDKLCQGHFEQLINLSNNRTPYPNPFQNYLNLNIGQENESSASVEIYDLRNGRKVYEDHYLTKAGVKQLNLSGLKSGMYSLHFNSGNTKNIYKIYKQ